MNSRCDLGTAASALTETPSAVQTLCSGCLRSTPYPSPRSLARPRRRGEGHSLSFPRLWKTTFLQGDFFKPWWGYLTRSSQSPSPPRLCLVAASIVFTEFSSPTLQASGFLRESPRPCCWEHPSSSSSTSPAFPAFPMPGRAGLRTQPGPTTTLRLNHPSLFDATLLQRLPPSPLTKCVFPPVPRGELIPRRDGAGTPRWHRHHRARARGGLAGGSRHRIGETNVDPSTPKASHPPPGGHRGSGPGRDLVALRGGDARRITEYGDLVKY